MLDLIIKNGTVVTAADTFKADIGIKDGTIVELTSSSLRSRSKRHAREVIDASDKLIFPGVIDVHTHMGLSVGDTVAVDDFFSGTRAAACGGVTTIIDFAVQRKGGSLREAIAERRMEAEDNVCVDYSLHVCITDPNRSTVDEIPQVIADGMPSFKLFTAYAKRGLMLDDGQIYALLEEVACCDGLVIVHAENEAIIRYQTTRLAARGKLEPGCHPLSRPNLAEQEAIARVLLLAEAASASGSSSSIYIVHLTTREGLSLVREAKLKHSNNSSVYAETCPQYLLLSDAKYQCPDAYLYAVTPPLRALCDQQALWHGLQEGIIDVVSTDHCSFGTHQKARYSDDFTKIPNGLPGVETLLPLMFTRGVKQGRLTPSDLVRLLSYNPSRIFRLYPRKGTIAIGSDADMVIFDPGKRLKLSQKRLHMKVDWSPFEGFELEGYPEATILRGRLVYCSGRFLGEKGYGQFIPRYLP